MADPSFCLSVEHVVTKISYLTVVIISAQTASTKNASEYVHTLMSLRNSWDTNEVGLVAVHKCVVPTSKSGLAIPN